MLLLVLIKTTVCGIQAAWPLDNNSDDIQLRPIGTLITCDTSIHMLSHYHSYFIPFPSLLYSFAHLRSQEYHTDTGYVQTTATPTQRFYTLVPI
jgi:hypothetical protein